MSFFSIFKQKHPTVLKAQEVTPYAIMVASGIGLRLLSKEIVESDSFKLDKFLMLFVAASVETAKINVHYYINNEKIESQINKEINKGFRRYNNRLTEYSLDYRERLSENICKPTFAQSNETLDANIGRWFIYNLFDRESSSSEIELGVTFGSLIRNMFASYLFFYNPNPPKVDYQDNVAEEKIKQKQSLDELTVKEDRVILNCKIKGDENNESVRIWDSTFLIDNKLKHQSKLIKATNISIYPEWTNIDIGEALNFTLEFAPLPDGCKAFDLIEDIPESGGWEIRNIKRNSSDIYEINL